MGQRQTERVVCRGGNARLELSGKLVGQVPNRATAEPRQTGEPGDAFSGHHAVDQVKRVGIAQVRRAFASLIDGVIVENGKRALEASGDERVAGDELAAFNAFQQEAARPRTEFEQGRDGRLDVGQHLAVNGCEVRRSGHAAQRGQSRVVDV